jgi:hypothetical protein
MLRSIKSILGYAVKARDGDIGKTVDFYFDDKFWTIRYLVAETHVWLPGKKVLISSHLFTEHPVWDKNEFPVELTKQKIKDSPDIDTAKPVSREKELELLQHYSWPVYWQGTPLMTVPPVPAMYTPPKKQSPPASQEQESDTHMRSVKEVDGYHLKAKDGRIGHIKDFIVDDENWSIRYIVVDTGKWLPGKKVLVAPYWIVEFRWLGSLVIIDLNREEIRQSPPYDPEAPVNREYEERLYDYYGKPKYWHRR